MGSKQDPSCRWMKERPALESRRERTPPRTVTSVPTGMRPCRASETLTAAMASPAYRKNRGARRACVAAFFEASSPTPVADESRPKALGPGGKNPHVPTDVPSVLKTVQRPRRALVTSGMPYANGPLHLGHLAGAHLPADIYSRWSGRLIWRENVLFLDGTDDHGSTSEVSAAATGIP